MEQDAVRSRRRADFRNYPIGLAWRYLTPQQQAERRETLADVRVSCLDWLSNPALSARQRRVLADIARHIDMGRARVALSPAQWEAFWEIRDFLMPPPVQP